MRKNLGITPRALLKKYTVGYPMERIAMDLSGPYEQTARGNVYILVISDYFSKWSQAIQLPKKTTETVAKALISNWLSFWGCPISIHTDQGKEFVSLLMQQLCEMLGIEKTRTTTYMPKSDGLVERQNRSIAQMINTSLQLTLDSARDKMYED